MEERDFVGVLSGVRGGDEGAFGRLWRCYQPYVLRYLTALVGTAAEDVASETWIAVMRGISRFSGDERGFRRWLATVARHRAIDWGRERQRIAVPAEADELASRLPATADCGTAAIDRLTGREAARLIADVLPPAEAEAVILRFLLGFDIADTAEVLGKREGAVRVLTHRGLRRLAEQFQPRPSAGTGMGQER